MASKFFGVSHIPSDLKIKSSICTSISLLIPWINRKIWGVINNLLLKEANRYFLSWKQKVSKKFKSQSILPSLSPKTRILLQSGFYFGFTSNTHSYFSSGSRTLEFQFCLFFMSNANTIVRWPRQKPGVWKGCELIFKFGLRRIKKIGERVGRIFWRKIFCLLFHL